MAEYSLLIIDDDIWMQRILSKTMNSYGFKKAFLASNGFDGVALAVEHRPTLIFLDILMPELSGHLTLKLLKKIKLTRDIPVLVVSALSDVENLGMAVKSGISGFISKPFTRATIYEKLVDVFGKEQLDMIARGDDISLGRNIMHEQLFADNSEKKTEEPQPPSRESGETESKDSSKPTKSQSSEKIPERYKDEDKRSIESIKKMLLKKK
jgi:PleD family two-component response regulator